MRRIYYRRNDTADHTNTRTRTDVTVNMPVWSRTTNDADTGAFFFFFFSSRRRHTRCLSDWSSDVCSSDLQPIQRVNVDVTASMLEELDKAAQDLNVSRQAVIKTLVRHA